MDAFHALDPRNIPKDLPSVYGEKEIDLIYDFYGSNKINIFQGQRNEATAIIKCSKENFIDQPVHYFRLMSKKKAYFIIYVSQKCDNNRTSFEKY